MNKNITIFILIGLVVLLLFLHINGCNKHKRELASKNNLIEALNDTLKITKNKDSSSTATIAVLQTERTKDFLNLQTKDQEIAALQELVREYKKVLVAGSSVTKGLIETVAELRKTTPPTIIKVDSVKGEDSMIYVYPTYKDSVDNKWVKVVSTMGKDSSNFSIAVNNEFSAIVGSDKGKPFVDVNLSNPYSTVKSLRSYQVSIPKPKKWVVGLGGGYGLSLPQTKTSGFIGIFAGYTIFRF